MSQDTPNLKDLPIAVRYKEWLLWQSRAALAITNERALRASLLEELFPQPEEGSKHHIVTLELDGARFQVDFTAKQQVERKVDPAVLDNLKKVPELAAVPFDALIREKPELNVKPYKLLDPNLRALFDQCLTTKFASAQLEAKVTPL